MPVNVSTRVFYCNTAVLSGLMVSNCFSAGMSRFLNPLLKLTVA